MANLHRLLLDVSRLGLIKDGGESVLLLWPFQERSYSVPGGIASRNISRHHLRPAVLTPGSHEFIAQAAHTLAPQSIVGCYNSLIDFNLTLRADPSELISQLNDLAVGTLCFNAEYGGGIKGQPPMLQKKNARNKLLQKTEVQTLNPKPSRPTVNSQDGDTGSGTHNTKL